MISIPFNCFLIVRVHYISVKAMWSLIIDNYLD